MNHKLETMAGDNFTNVAEKAKEIAQEKTYYPDQKKVVEFNFNGITCLADQDTDLEWLYRDYSNSWTMEWETIGPDCLKEYNKKTQSKLERLTKIKEEKAAKEDEEYRKKELAEKEAFELKVKGIEIELKDPEGWKEGREANTDPYGKAGFDYAEYWARLMQAEIASGKTLIQCAKETSHELGFLGITGFLYGCAVNILSQTWIHGDELRKWHNKDYGHGGNVNRIR